MKLLKRKIAANSEVKKSRFLTYIYPVANQEEVKFYLRKIKDENPGYRHVIYAYITSDFKMGASEDKEPINSAHRILNTLKSREVAGIACFVVRFFGGVLLGASNLDRTYVKCVFDHLADSDFGERIALDIYRGEISNNMLKNFEKLIDVTQGEIIEKSFLGPRVRLTFALQEKDKCKLNDIFITEIEKLNDKITKIV